jgi:hypothetical protein
MRPLHVDDMARSNRSDQWKAPARPLIRDFTDGSMKVGGIEIASLSRGPRRAAFDPLFLRIQDAAKIGPGRRRLGAGTTWKTGLGRRPTLKPGSGPGAQWWAYLLLPAPTSAGRASSHTSAQDGHGVSSLYAPSEIGRTGCTGRWTSWSACSATSSTTAAKSPFSSPAIRVYGDSVLFSRPIWLRWDSRPVSTISPKPTLETKLLPRRYSHARKRTAARCGLLVAADVGNQVHADRVSLKEFAKLAAISASSLAPEMVRATSRKLLPRAFFWAAQRVGSPPATRDLDEPFQRIRERPERDGPPLPPKCGRKATSRKPTPPPRGAMLCVLKSPAAKSEMQSSLDSRRSSDLAVERSLRWPGSACSAC